MSHILQNCLTIFFYEATYTQFFHEANSLAAKIVACAVCFRVKSVQTQLAQKEGMVKVFQRSPMARSSSVHTIYCSPLHSPRPSIMAASLSHQSSLSDTTSYKDYMSSVKHVKSGKDIYYYYHLFYYYYLMGRHIS